MTSVGGVNWGTKFADVMQGAVKVDSVIESLVKKGMDTLAHVITSVSEGETLPEDNLLVTESLTTAGSLLFNQTYPEGMPVSYCGTADLVGTNGVYYSWSGAKPFTHVSDPVDYAFELTSLVFDENNDGVVTSCSSHLGQVIKDDYYMNHMDEVNQTFGLTSWFETDPVTLYRQHVTRLKAASL